MNYEEFILQKQTSHKPSGFDVKESELNENLFDFQKYIVRKALQMGKYALFEDCGLGKTIQQLEWAHQVVEHTGGRVLILAPLAVSGQTIKEGEKFGIEISRWNEGQMAMYTVNKLKGIWITNYEQLEKIPAEHFEGIVLDESSILKNFTGKYKNLIIDKFKLTPYKLACTATPSPNDFNELGNHSEFLSIMDANDMRMRWFVRDEGMNNYRIKGHAKKDFFSWIASWATMITTPADIGFSDEGYILPKLNFYDHEVKVTHDGGNGKLFNDVSVNATNFNRELRVTLVPRLELVNEIVKDSDQPFIIWVNQNREEDAVKELIPEAVTVRGSEQPHIKEKKLLDFAASEFRVLCTKKKIAQFGMNFQNCNNQVFASLDFSFEGLYQSIRRSYRFGQDKAVNIYLITTDTMKNVIASIKRKESEFNEMKEEMREAINATQKHNLKISYDMKETNTENYHVINGDCVNEIKNLESDSMDLSVFSPPFSTLFTYSDNLHDMGNCENDKEFFEQTSFLLPELYRVMKPGRLVCVHSKDLAKYKGSSGFSGMYNFTAEYHKAMEDAGFKYHCRITIWTDPVLEMQRTKTQRLLYKQLKKDSSYTGVGMPEYLTVFRKWEGNEEDWTPVESLNAENFPLDTWQKWASPVWMDIRRTDVLNDYRGAKGARDEKHICPLQLGVIERCVAMWSNEGERVFSPFAGIGSEGFQAIKMGRKFTGIELKEGYYNVAIRNLNNAIALTRQQPLFT